MPAIASIQSSSNSALCLFSPGKSQSRLRNPSHLLPLSTLRDDNQQSKSPQSEKLNFPVCFNWIFGWIFSLILPLAHLKGGDLQRLGGPLGQVEKVVETLEEVAEVAEEVAEVVEKVSSEVAENVPDDSILKKTALVVEQASELVEKDAKLTMEFMQKVDEIKGQVEEVVEITLKVKAVAGEEARKE